MWEMRSRYQGEDEWALIVDLDEFVDFADGITGIIASAEAEGANVVRGIMYDRFPADGRLVDFDPALELAPQYPVRSTFIRDVMHGNDTKAVLVKGRLQAGFWAGNPAEHHFMVGEKVASTVLAIDHYRWVGTSVEHLRDRRKIFQGIGGFLVGHVRPSNQALRVTRQPLRLAGVRRRAPTSVRTAAACNVFVGS